MTFVFVARRAAEVVEYDVRRTEVTDVKLMNKSQYRIFMMLIKLVLIRNITKQQLHNQEEVIR